MAKKYDEDANFNGRFEVVTNFGGELVDHHKEFQARTYAQTQNKVYQPPEGSQLGNIKRGQRSKVEAPKPQPKRRAKNTTTDKQDADLKKAANKDLTTRGL